MLCGDEVGAVVSDMGSNVCRFGSAGQDSPPHIHRSDFGVYNDSNIIIGDNKLRNLRENVDVASIFSNGEINWDATEAMLEYGIQSCLRDPETSCPLLLAENYFNTAERKEKLYELLFEKMRLPATYSCHNATLSSFCSARSTSLIVDLGATEIRVVPVVDGFALNRCVVRSSRGGDSIDKQLETLLSSKQSKKREAGDDSSQLKPWFMCKGSTRPKGLTDSFIQMHRNDIIRDVKHWMCFIPPQAPSPGEERDVDDLIKLIPPYELPDGTKVMAEQDISMCIEKHIFPYQPPPVAPFKSSRSRRSRGGGDLSNEMNDEDPLHRLVYNAIDRCDVDVRKELFGNIVLVGGGSLLDGLANRLSKEIPKMVPSNVKVKVVSSMSALEKHHAAWIGGSILSICGSFQQMWISREEYDEHGPRVYKKKCQH